MGVRPPAIARPVPRLVDHESARAVRELMEDWLGYPSGSRIDATPLDNLATDPEAPLVMGSRTGILRASFGGQTVTVPDDGADYLINFSHPYGRR